MKCVVFFLVLALLALPACFPDFGPGTFTERSRTYSPDSTKFLLNYAYEQGAWDGGRSYFIAILKITDSVESTASQYKFFSYDVDDVYWQGSDTVIVAEKFTEFVSRGKSQFKDSIFPMNGTIMKVVHKDPIDTSYERKVFYRETSPSQKYDLIVYRYVKPVNGYYFLNISVIHKNDSIPKYGNFYVSRFDFDCFNDIRWLKGDTLDIKVSRSCFYSFEDYLVKNRRDTGIRYKVQVNDTIRGNITDY